MFVWTPTKNTTLIFLSKFFCKKKTFHFTFISIFSSKSILDVKNFSNSDIAMYTCFTFDYSNASLSNEKVIYGQVNVTASLLNNGISGINSDSVSEKKIITCTQEENECKNGGQCLKTNPKFYKNTLLYHLLKTKFCM